MKKITIEQMKYINPEFQEELLDLINDVSKYKGKYKEWLMALLMLKIDILKDDTFDEKELNRINKSDIVQRVINYNTYCNIRKHLKSYDDSLTWPGMGYNGLDYCYPVWHDKFEEEDPRNPRGAADQNEILKIHFSDTDNKTIVTLTGETIVSSSIRYEQMDKIIARLYEASQKKTIPKACAHYHYSMEMGQMIVQLFNILCRNTKLTEEQEELNEYLCKLYKKLSHEYGPFINRVLLPNQEHDNIDLDTHSVITETSTIKDTPVLTWKKKNIYF